MNDKNDKIINIFKKITAITLVAAGISVIAFPWAKAWYFNMLQNKAMLLWQESVLKGEARIGSKDGNSTSAEEGVYGEHITDADRNIDAGGAWEEDVDQAYDLEYVKNKTEGIITIDKIKLKAPILKDATSYNLNISVCSVANTGKMGEAGNYVLAGHRSRIKDRHFNRLPEVSAGDKVVVEDGINTYEYTVTEIIVVTPEETWVMDADGEKKLLTLITCDYSTTPANRLIVKCELTS